MKAKNELEFLVALIQEYTNNMPQASKLAVTNHAQGCVDVVFKALTELDELLNKETPPAEPTQTP